jgi:hypothetical protein
MNRFFGYSMPNYDHDAIKPHIGSRSNNTSANVVDMSNKMLKDTSGAQMSTVGMMLDTKTHTSREQRITTDSAAL